VSLVKDELTKIAFCWRYGDWLVFAKHYFDKLADNSSVIVGKGDLANCDIVSVALFNGPEAVSVGEFLAVPMKYFKKMGNTLSSAKSSCVRSNQVRDIGAGTLINCDYFTPLGPVKKMQVKSHETLKKICDDEFVWQYTGNSAAGDCGSFICYGSDKGVAICGIHNYGDQHVSSYGNILDSFIDAIEAKKPTIGSAPELGCWADFYKVKVYAIARPLFLCNIKCSIKVDRFSNPKNSTFLNPNVPFIPASKDFSPALA